MIRFAIALLLSLLTIYDLALAGTFDLGGSWLRSQAGPDEKPIQFISVGTQFRSHSSERFVFENGRLSHTIDQSVKINKTDLTGTVSFYDSRGCSFKDLDVIVEVQGQDVVNVLMTVPRYKFVTISRTPQNRWERPTVIRTECRVLEYVEVPVQLYRM